MTNFAPGEGEGDPASTGGTADGEGKPAAGGAAGAAAGQMSSSMKRRLRRKRNKKKPAEGAVATGEAGQGAQPAAGAEGAAVSPGQQPHQQRGGGHRGGGGGGGGGGKPRDGRPHGQRPGGPRPQQPQAFTVSIPGFDPRTAPRIKPFDELTVIDPKPRLTLEYRGCPDSCRLVDLFCPIGRGQRALIVSPPKAGKTTLLKDISGAIVQNHPDVTVIALLIDERPEEVTDFKRTFSAFGNHPDGTPRCEVLASSNDHNNDKHTSLALGAMELTKRMVEAGRHVVVVLDSLTRLARSFNNSRRFANSGRTMSGGLDAKALEIPRQIFGSARNTEEAGSLTIIATCLVDTGSVMDQVIFEEFKGSGNMELILDRKIAERRLFPAINLGASGTRKEELMLDMQTVKTVTALRRRLIAMPPHVQVEQLIAAMKRFPDNAALVGTSS